MSQITSFSIPGTPIVSITGNVGGAVSPDAAGDIGFTGSVSITITGTPGTNSLVATVSGGTDGQLLISSAAGTPIWANITSTANRLDITNGTNTIDIDTLSVLQTDTGFATWTGTGSYYDDTTLGQFDVLRGGTGYIKGVLVSWAGSQNVTGMISGTAYYIYIDDTGTIGKASSRTDALYIDYIVLFQCWRDASLPTNNQKTVKENHSYNFPVNSSNYLHNTVGSVIENYQGGANITLNGTQKIDISGSDELDDHGLETTIPDSGGVAETFAHLYTNAAGKWVVHAATDTFPGEYNNAGTVTALSTNKYGVYTLYVGKDDLNTSSPRFGAVLNTAQFNNLAGADLAISTGNVAVSTNELDAMENCRLGYIVYSEASSSIVDVIIDKNTLRSSNSTSGTNTASLINTNVTNFDGILTAADTNVQASLETIDDWGKTASRQFTTDSGNAVPSSEVITIAGGTNIATSGAGSTVTCDLSGTTDHAIQLGNAGGSITSFGLGDATKVLTSAGAGADPTWEAPTVGSVTSVTGGSNITDSGTATDPVLDLDSSPSVSGSVTAGTGMTITTGDLDVSSGSINLPTTTASDGIININSSPVLHTYGASNTFIGGAGNFTLSGATGNIGIGPTALDSITTGDNNVVIGTNTGTGLTTSSNNVAIGLNAMQNATGNTQVAIGPNVKLSGSCEFGTFIGSEAWKNGTNGYYSTAIGHRAGYNYAGAERDNICLMNPGVVGDTHTMRLGKQGTSNGQQDKTFIAGIYNTAPSGGSDNVVVIDSNGQLGAQASLDVANGGTGAATLTDHGVLLGNATGAVTATAELSSGQLLIGNTGNVPTLATLTAGSGISVTNAAGSITVSSTSTTLNNQTGTAYTLVLTDAGKHITLTNAAAITVTIPTNAAVAFPIGTVISFSQGGAGQATFAGAVPPTLRSADSALTTVKIYSVCSCIKIATDEWIFGGDLEA